MTAVGGAPLRRSTFLLLVFGYFGLHLVIRTLEPAWLGLDDAEQFVAAQDWALGYGPQPPLATWIFKLLFAAFGEGVFAVALFRNACLAATVVLVAAIGRRIGGDRVALAAGLGVLTIPQIAWESQHSHIHTLLVVVTAALAVLFLLRIVEARRTADYLGFGAALGLAFLSKLSGPLLPLALLAVMAAMRETRPSVLDRRLLAGLGLGLLVVAPAAVWMLAHRAATMGRVYKFKFAEAAGPLDGVVTAVGAALSFSAVTMAVFLLLVVLTRREEGLAVAAGRGARLGRLAAGVGLAIAVIAAGVVVTGAAEVKERWLQPVLFPLPVLVAAAFAPRLGDRFLRDLSRVVAVLAVVILVGVPIKDRFGSLRRPPLTSVDYALLRGEIAAAVGPVGTLFSDGHSLPGNLRLADPSLVAVVPEYPQPGLDLPGPWIAIWRDEEPMPQELADLVAARGASVEGPVTRILIPHVWPFEGTFVVHVQRLAAGESH